MSRGLGPAGPRKVVGPGGAEDLGAVRRWLDGPRVRDDDPQLRASAGLEDDGLAAVVAGGPCEEPANLTGQAVLDVIGASVIVTGRLRGLEVGPHRNPDGIALARWSMAPTSPALSHVSRGAIIRYGRSPKTTGHGPERRHGAIAMHDEGRGPRLPGGGWCASGCSRGIGRGRTARLRLDPRHDDRPLQRRSRRSRRATPPHCRRGRDEGVPARVDAARSMARSGRLRRWLPTIGAGSALLLGVFGSVVLGVDSRGCRPCSISPRSSPAGSTCSRTRSARPVAASSTSTS